MDRQQRYYCNRSEALRVLVGTRQQMTTNGYDYLLAVAYLNCQWTIQQLDEEHPEYVIKTFNVQDKTRDIQETD